MIQACHDDLPMSGGTMFLPAKVYRISSGVLIYKSNISFVCAEGTLLQQAVADIDLLRIAPGTQGTTIAGCHLDGAGLGTSVGFRSLNRGLVLCDETYGADVTGIVVRDLEISGFRNQGLSLSRFCTQVRVMNVYIHDIGDLNDFTLSAGEGIGFNVGGPGSCVGKQISGLQVVNLRVEITQNTGISVSGLGYSDFHDLTVQRSPTGIQAGVCVDHLSFRRVHIEDIGNTADDLEDIAIGFGLRSAATNISIRDLYVRNVKDDSAKVTGYCYLAQGFPDSFDNELVGAYVQDCGSAGIAISGPGQDRHIISEVVVKDVDGPGIWLDGVSNATVSSFLVARGGGPYGFRIEATRGPARHLRVSDGVVREERGICYSVIGADDVVFQKIVAEGCDEDEKGRPAILVNATRTVFSGFVLGRSGAGRPLK